MPAYIGTRASLLRSPTSLGALLTPPVTSGLVLQLDANQLTSTTTNGASTASWTDAVGGIVFSQGTGATQPTYQTNVYNGRPCLRFNGSQYVVASGIVAALNGSDITLFAVVKFTSGSNTRIFSNANSGNLGGFTFGLDGTPGWIWRIGTGGTFATLATGGSAGTALHMVIGEQDSAASGNIPGSLKQGLYVDSATLGASGSSTYTTQSTITPAVGTAASSLNSNNFTGDICEICIWNRALTNAEVATLRTSYAQPKWGTP